VTIAIIFTLTWLAFTNGSNDNFKGVATLFGSGQTSYSRALTWATMATLAGALAAIALGSGLAAKFAGRGVVPDGLANAPEFALSVALAAAGTVMLATRTGFPISTTHALVGALLGAGLAIVPDAVSLKALGKSFLVPLLLSPVASLVLTYSAWFVAARVPTLISSWARGFDVATAATVPSTGLVSRSGGLTPMGRFLDFLHLSSGGAVCFARALNDTPKIAALAATVPSMSMRGAALVVAVAMTLGGVFGGRRVAEKMSHGVTGMTERQGLVANLVTGALVLAASSAVLPVSTTHVSVGSLFGIGSTRADVKKGAVVQIVLAWLITVPIASAQAAVWAHVLMRFRR
jgi:inorganic phosphate transporter, PiT family